MATPHTKDHQTLTLSDFVGGGRSHALVIGGSVAGLLAARVLANHFDRVTIVKRDCFPESSIPRKGVPQAHHLHVLLSRGRIIMEGLFPGVGDQLIAAGAHVVDAGMDQVVKTSAESTYVLRLFLEVLSMLRPPSAMFRPGIIMRVLWQALGKRTSAQGGDEYEFYLPKTNSNRCAEQLPSGLLPRESKRI